MDVALRQETEKLLRSWTRHDSSWLRDYLVAGVEDPRLNLQSIFTRHFLIRSLCGTRFDALMEHECRFSATLLWLEPLIARPGAADTSAAIRDALKRNTDNAEGLPIPLFVRRTYAMLPTRIGELEVPNYLDLLLSPSQGEAAKSGFGKGRDTFGQLWRAALSSVEATEPLPSVLESACGSANDFRFFGAFGLARLLDYTGFDLCPSNVENARALFPEVRFQVGNVFEIPAPEKSVDYCVVHDLFEHLSIAGLEAAIRELCRVTRRGMSVGFFQMDEIPDHIVRPLEDYHCNLLSMQRTREQFAACGFAAQILHVGTFLRQQLGCEQTHNPNAYSFWLRSAPN